MNTRTCNLLSQPQQGPTFSRCIVYVCRDPLCSMSDHPFSPLHFSHCRFSQQCARYMSLISVATALHVFTFLMVLMLSQNQNIRNICKTHISCIHVSCQLFKCSPKNACLVHHLPHCFRDPDLHTRIPLVWWMHFMVPHCESRWRSW